MQKKILNLISLGAIVLSLTSCGKDTTAPVFTSVTANSDTYYTNEPFRLNVEVSDDVSENLSLSVTITAPSGAKSSSTIDAVTLKEDGVNEISVTATDEAGNIATSETLSINAFDPYAHWNAEEIALMETSPGFIVPKSRFFAETTTVSQSENLAGTLLGVIIDNTGLNEEQIADYEALLVREGFISNEYELVYFGSTILNSTHISVFDKHTADTSYQRLQNYYYNGDYKIEARRADYVISHDWDETYVAGVITEAYVPLVPAFTFEDTNEEGILYLSDYNDIMSSMGTIGAIQGKMYHVTIDEISSYLDKLAELGYTDGSIDDLIANETTAPMYTDPTTYAMVMIQISSYLDASLPFYTIDIMCM